MAVMPAQQSVRWYKKIDSTLRGNIGAELDAMLDRLAASGRAMPALVSPAFPAQQRGVDNGFLVYTSPGGRTPPRVSLPALLAEQSRRTVASIALAEVRGDANALALHLRALRDAGAEVLTADALTDDDLVALYVAAQVGLGEALYCGSAGLVGVVAAAMAREQGLPPRGRIDLPPLLTSGPVLVVAGSGSDMAHAQIARLRAVSGCCAVEIGGEPPAANDPMVRCRCRDPIVPLAEADVRHAA